MTIWKAGMLAVCIMEFRDPAYNTGLPLPVNAPRMGAILRVDQVSFDWDGIVCLGFVGIASDHVFDARGFRPLNDAEDDAELIARIKACTPQRVPEVGMMERRFKAIDWDAAPLAVRCPVSIGFDLGSGNDLTAYAVMRGRTLIALSRVGVDDSTIAGPGARSIASPERGA